MSDVVAIGTRARGNGGLVHAYIGNSIAMMNIIAIDTSAGGDGGLGYAFASSITLSTINATNTSAASRGGLVYALGGSTTIMLMGIVVSGTAAESGGGLVAADAGAITLTTAIVTDTSAGSADGGLAQLQNSALLTMSDVLATNTSAGTAAGLFALTAAAQVDLRSCGLYHVAAPTAAIATLPPGSFMRMWQTVFSVACNGAGTPAAPLSPTNAGEGKQGPSDAAGTGSLFSANSSTVASLSSVRIELGASCDASIVDGLPQLGPKCADATFDDPIAGNPKKPICARQAKCTDIPLMAGSSSTGPHCACPAPNTLLNVQGDARVEDPYNALHLCAQPRGMAQIIRTESSITTSLNKPELSRQIVELNLEMEGPAGEAVLNVTNADELPTWVHLLAGSSSFISADAAATILFSVELIGHGLRERSEAYETHLSVLVTSAASAVSVATERHTKVRR